jgi:hypothetical protein
MKNRSINRLLACCAGAIALLAACVDDRGNYLYAEPEAPVVIIEKSYAASVGERLVVRPEVTFSDTARLTYTWEISDPVLMMSHIYEGPVLDIFFNLRAQAYSAQLTVADPRLGMKYFYPFTIDGRTSFSEGTVVLLDRGSASELAFISPGSAVTPTVYALMNEGEALPPFPRQLVALYNPNYVGGLYLGYWVICGDGDDPGVLVDVNTFVTIRHFKENFFDIPVEPVNAQYFTALDNGTMAGVVDGKFQVGRFEGYHEWPGFGFFSPPIQGNYTLAPRIAVGADGTFHWGYDIQKRALICFIPPAGMMFEATHMQGPPVNWDPAHVDIDFITLLTGPTGFFLYGTDDAGIVTEFVFTTGGQFVMSQTRRPFAHAALLTPRTLWAIYLTEIYFSSGSTVYSYNPGSQQITALSAVTLPGEVTMLKVGRDAGQLLVGTAGHLYWLDINPGQNGRVIRHVEGLDGAPVDVYERR